MSSEYKCIRCGEADFEKGTVQSAGSVSFRPKDTKFLTMSPGNVSVASRICLTCGLLELSANIKEIKSMIKAEN